ncbi:MAG TPA: M42 family peptidase [Clostridia bacterium]|nr:M42 family peptidase [Clostridia bacterium]
MHVDPNCVEMIRALSDARAPSGFEDEALLAARRFAGSLGRIEEDCMRNLYLFREKNCGKPMLMLDAHADEVGIMIQAIKPNGTLRFVSLGTWTEGSLKGTKVLVRNAEGQWIPGVVASRPPHFMGGEDQKGVAEGIRSLVIDVGARDEAEARDRYHIRIGEPAVPATAFSYDRDNDIMMGKAFDCRIGCAVLLETMRRLRDEELGVDVAASISSQEEFEGHGCMVAVNRIKPAAAIVFEGCPADDTFNEPYAVQTALKGGPMIRFMDVSMIANPRFQRYALDLAQELGMPLQASVREGGGNNGAAICRALRGAPVIVMGVPVRYIHTPCGITSYFDFEATAAMAVEIVKRLDAALIASF